MNPGLEHFLARKATPRPAAGTGPALFSLGFRPFFLMGGIFALLTLGGWIGALTLGWDVGGEYGALNWHAHEMLFGYTSAALAGFLLTAVPNWTGRPPLSGRPLMALAGLWLLGRLVMLAPGVLGLPMSLVLEACFMPALAVVIGTDVVAARNWKNLKVFVALGLLVAANVAFHLSVAFGGTAMDASRFTTAIYMMLIALVGGRIIPAFTRNWLIKSGAAVVPKPFDRFDLVAMVALLLALLCWIAMPEGLPTAVLATLAAALHAVRIWRWRGWQTLEEPLLVALHVAYGFVALGLAALAMSAMDWIAEASALHVMTVGCIGGMTFAVMTRVSLGHTGRPLTASPLTSLAYLALALAAIVRPFAEILSEQYHMVLMLGGLGWVLAFTLFVIEYAPILLRPRPVMPRPA